MLSLKGDAGMMGPEVDVMVVVWWHFGGPVCVWRVTVECMMSVMEYDDGDADGCMCVREGLAAHTKRGKKRKRILPGQGIKMPLINTVRDKDAPSEKG
jgi:hypothetical protein